MAPARAALDATSRAPRPGLALALAVVLAVAALWYVTLVRIPLGTVALEETLFRGVLLGLGLRRWRRGVAVAWRGGLWQGPGI